jgi:predicted ATPase/class 3 adenylate cyclase
MHKGAEQLPTGVVTFVMTDVQGSTRLWESEPEAMATSLRAHDEVVYACAERHNGHVLKGRGEGDSHFLVFGAAPDALAAALAMQLAFGDVGPLTLSVRCAIHTDEARPHGFDYYGPGVNRCARLRHVAHGGQVLLTEATASLVRKELPPGVTLEDLGTIRLKDLLRAEKVSQLRHPDLAGDFPLPASLDRVPHNLPVQLTALVGRDEEIVGVDKMLRKSRLVTLVGAGGCGKTRLALQAAAERVEEYPGGVWFVDLSRLPPHEDPAAAVARVLRLEAGTCEQLAEAASKEFASDTLLVLDNCEHMTSPVARLVQQLLLGWPQVTILVTSREALKLAPENAFRIPSLRVPEPGATLTAAEATEFASVRLFVERAGRRSGGFELQDANATSVGALCSLLQGIPLAIEQAACYTDILSPHQILTRLKTRMVELRTDEREVLERHQTMRATIDWSFGLLSASERELLVALAAFTGGCTLEAAEAVCASPALPADDIALGLQDLVSKSLLYPEEGRGSRRRLRFLEPIRQYAAERLAGREEELASRHFEYFWRFATEAEGALEGRDQAQWLLAFDAEAENFRAAIEWNCSRGDPRALELAVALRQFWRRAGRLRLGVDLTESCLRALPDAEASMRATALNVIGAYCVPLGDYVRARAALEESLEIRQSLGQVEAAASVLHNLGYLAGHLGDWAEAAAFFGEGLRAYRSSGDERNQARCLLNLGRLSLDRGDCEGAVPALLEACDLLEATGDLGDLAMCRVNLAEAFVGTAREPEALPLMVRSLEYWRETHDPLALNTLLYLVAEIWFDRGRSQEAARIFGAAEAGRQEARAFGLGRPGRRRAQLQKSLTEGAIDRQVSRAFRAGAALDYLGTVRQALEDCERLVSAPLPASADSAGSAS